MKLQERNEASTSEALASTLGSKLSLFRSYATCEFSDAFLCHIPNYLLLYQTWDLVELFS